MSNGLMQRLSNEFKNKNVLVVGLGLQGGGIGIAKFFSELGSLVKVTDLKSKDELQDSIEQLKVYDISYTLGEHKQEDFLKSDIIFKGPSVPWDLPELLEAEKKGVPIEMEAAFTASHLKAKLIGVTGTRGKTTTTEMIYSLLKLTGKKVFKAGNISGVSTINILKDAKEEDIVLFELSSWSLSGFHKKKISPNISVFTNFYPDHLNYYKNLEDYFYDKKAIYLHQNQDDISFINSSLKDRIDDKEVNSKIIYFDKSNFEFKLDYLKGEHNKENAAAAVLVAGEFGIIDSQIEPVLKEFKPERYRQEVVRKIDAVTIVNDSTSTTPTSTIKAIESFKDKPIILILGGHSKNLPVDQLTSKLEDVSYIVLIKGSLTDEIFHELNLKYKNKISEVFSDLDSAISFSFSKAKELNEECYLILSPGATSFAMFKNEFDMGVKFNEYVAKL
ncbi:MAG: UDP-N-acetylmuramoyl-L-alanine--D-glutamate ligase [Patescibacteria group bacterium]